MKNIFTIGMLFCAMCSYASNKIVTVETPGTLGDQITEEEKFDITNLKVIGSINGTDIRLIREMAGNDFYTYATDGKLSELDLSEARIVKGGDTYLMDPATYEEEGVLFNDVIGYNMFQECKSLVTVVLPEGITRISDEAFLSCTNLKNINIPSTVTKIGGAFRKCTSLETIEIPASVKTLDDFCFSHCEAMTEFTIPTTVEDLGEACFNYTSLKTITIPENITSLGRTTFGDCYELKSVYFSDKIRSIAANCFIRDSNLTELHFAGVTPPTIGSDAFYGVKNCTVYVPSEDAVAAYQEKFPGFDVKVATATGINGIADNDASAYYDLTGKAASKAQSGIVIVRLANGKTVKVLDK